MRLQDSISLELIIRELEGVMGVDLEDYEVSTFSEIVARVKSRIRANYAVDVDTAGFDKEISQSPELLAQSAVTFLQAIGSIYESVCAYGHKVRFTQYNEIDLRKVKCFGFTESSLKATLFTAQTSRTIERASDALYTVVNSLYSIQLCFEKRLFIVAMLAYEFGLKELAAAIFEIFALSLIGGVVD